MKLFRWFRGRRQRHEPADGSKGDQAATGASKDINDTVPAGKALTRLTADAFARHFLEWTSRHGIHGPTDVRRLENLMVHFADEHDLMPLEPRELFRALDRLGIGAGEREVHAYEYGFGGSAGRRLTTRFYVLPQHFPIRPAPREHSAPSPSPQLDLFKPAERGPNHGR